VRADCIGELQCVRRHVPNEVVGCPVVPDVVGVDTKKTVCGKAARKLNVSREASMRRAYDAG